MTRRQRAEEVARTIKESWQCEGCGDVFTEDHGTSHPRHHHECDGSCQAGCPVECGPITSLLPDRIVAALLAFADEEIERAMRETRYSGKRIGKRGIMRRVVQHGVEFEVDLLECDHKIRLSPFMYRDSKQHWCRECADAIAARREENP